MKSTTLELAEWKLQHSNISSKEQAIHTAEMIRYAESYYVPGGEYRSTPEIEKALQSQRQDTIESFAAALRTYTGADYGTDVDKWLEYLQSR